jgi:putative transcriptional regulator
MRKTLDRNLKCWRKQVGLTQRQAAHRLNVSVRTFQEWEQGRMKPRGFSLSALQAAVRKELKDI